jgi:hypothetical protein
VEHTNVIEVTVPLPNGLGTVQVSLDLAVAGRLDRSARTKAGMAASKAAKTPEQLAEAKERRSATARRGFDTYRERLRAELRAEIAAQS